jgi:RNA polymerase sigma-70 factor, ECF subfamily
MEATQSAIERVFREESGRVLANLIRVLGDFELAEDALQDAFAKAAIAWPKEGIPARPAAWITTVARNRGTDLRRRAVRVAPTRSGELPELPTPEPAPDDDEGFGDDRLRLMFTCCHPALSEATQVALTLRTLGGLSTPEIARAFLTPEVTMAQRLVRAKQKIKDAGIPYQIPPAEVLEERIEAVLATLYLIFNEGYAATEGDALVRSELCAEAIRLGRVLAELLPEEPEVLGLLALLKLHHARSAARVSPEGELVPLEDQDRTRWDHAAIAEGIAILDRAIAQRRGGPYQIQAAIAALHGRAATAAETDWIQIAALYGALDRSAPSAIVDLNRAVAIAMAYGARRGLLLLDELARRPELAGYHLLPAARADLFRRAGDRAAAASAYREAIVLTKNLRERAYLERRLAEVT